MKKLLIAAAAMSVVAGAQAQSSVTVYGNVDVAYGSNQKNTNQSGNTADIKLQGLMDGGITSNLIGFRGTEDLGGGTKANFTLESGLNITGGQMFSKSNTAIGANSYEGVTATGGSSANANGASTGSDHGIFGGATRQALIGVEGSFGRLDIGYKKMAELDAYESVELTTGNSFGTQAAKQGGRQDRANGFFYKSPVMSGTQATVQYSQGKQTWENATSDAAAKVDVSLIALTLNYTNGPIKAVAHRTDGNVEAGTGLYAADLTGQSTSVLGISGPQTSGFKFSSRAADAVTTVDQGKNVYESTILGGSYNFGFATAAVTYTDRTVGTASNTTDVTSYKYAVSAPFGKTTLIAGYETAKRELNGAKQDDIDGIQLIAKYDLSKRTQAYALYGQDKLKSATTAGSVVKYTTAIAGLRHSF
jgi:predicted porin